VKVGPRALAGIAGSTNHFSLIHTRSFMGEHRIEMGVERLVAIGVSYYHIIAEYRVVACIGDFAFTGGFDRGAFIDHDIDRRMK